MSTRFVQVLPRFLRSWVFCLVCAGLLALYAAAGSLLIPSVLKSQARDYVTRTYGRELAIGDVRFNPFTLALDVRNVALPDRDGRSMLQFDRLFVNLQAISLVRRAPSFQQILLERPGGRLVVRADGSVNFAELAPPSSPQAPAEPQPADPSPPRIFIEHFAVSGGQVEIEDLSRPTPFKATLAPITFQLSRFSSVGGDNAYQLSARSERGEQLDWSGSFQVAPVSSSGSFRLSGIQVRTVWDYVRDAVAFEIPSGQIDVEGRYQFALSPQPLLKVFGDSIRTQSVSLRPRDQTEETAEDWIALDALETRGVEIDLFARRVTVGSIQTRGGKVRAWLDESGQLNLPQLFAAVPGPAAEATVTAPATASTPAPEPATSEASWRISVPQIEVAALAVDFEDRGVSPAVSWKFAPINLTVSGYDTIPDQPLAVALDLRVDEDSAFSAKGTLQADTLAGGLDVQLEKFDLRPLQPYYQRHTDLTLTSGFVGVTGRLELKRDAAQALQPAFRGRVEVSSLRTIDNALEEDFIRWDRLALTDIDFDAAAHRLSIREIAARRPYARVIIASNGTVNLSTILNPKGSTPATATAEANPDADAQSPPTAQPPAVTSAQPAPEGAMRVKIGTVRFDRLSAHFADYSLQPNFATAIEELNGTVKGLSSDPKSRARVSLDGKVDAYAPVRIEGDINYLSADAYTDLKLKFDNLELTTFTPYSGKFAGYRIEKGKLAVDLKYHVENRQLQADHKFVLDQLTLGERVESADAVSLPIKLAVALLKDRNGVIDIDLPVSGSLDDPKFKLGPLIWKAVLGLLTKIATAPFALIGSLFGGGDEVNQIGFEAGQAQPAAASAPKIEALAKALRERPALQLEIPLSVNRVLDQRALQTSALESRLLAVKRRELLARRRSVEDVGVSVLADPQEHLRLLRELDHELRVAELGDPKLERETPPKLAADGIPAEIERLTGLVVPRLTVDEVAYADLAKNRAESVRERLLAAGDIDPGRLFIVAGAEASADGATVRMDLALR